LIPAISFSYGFSAGIGAAAEQGGQWRGAWLVRTGAGLLAAMEAFVLYGRLRRSRN
jgi:hypothetical protein